MTRFSFVRSIAGVSLVVGATLATAGQATQSPNAPAPASKGVPARTTPVSGSALPAAVPPTPVPVGVTPPPGYVIGPDDLLTIVFWGEKEMSAEVAVRPDGKISLPLINDVHAVGLTPEQLKANVTNAAAKYLENPAVTVVVKQINSRKVFITGEISKPGAYPLIAPTTVLQLIALAGGVSEFADRENIVVLRTENGRQMGYRFNYKDVLKRKNLRQNIELKPGDTILVP